MVAQDHIPKEVVWAALEPDFLMTFLYSVASSLQIWCRLWEARREDITESRLAETDLTGCFPRQCLTLSVLKVFLLVNEVSAHAVL